jgi:hypothetical protein
MWTDVSEEQDAKVDRKRAGRRQPASKETVTYDWHPAKLDWPRSWKLAGMEMHSSSGQPSKQPSQIVARNEPAENRTA